MTTRSPLASISTSLARGEDDPLVWNRPKITFVSTCPRCGHERFQHGYSRRMLFNLLNRRSKIDAYCIVCNVCWPISENERRAISPGLNTKPPTCNCARSAWCSQRRKLRDPNRRDYRNASEGQGTIQQALRTLRGIRLRYEVDRRNSDAPVRSVLVALSCADMHSITAAIEALESTIASDPWLGLSRKRELG